jgi:hypothetical protein
MVKNKLTGRNKPRNVDDRDEFCARNGGCDSNDSLSRTLVYSWRGHLIDSIDSFFWGPGFDSFMNNDEDDCDDDPHHHNKKHRRKNTQYYLRWMPQVVLFEDQEEQEGPSILL